MVYSGHGELKKMVSFTNELLRRAGKLFNNKRQIYTFGLLDNHSILDYFNLSTE